MLNLPATPSTLSTPTETESPNLHPNCVTVYLAAINWLDVHPYIDWFGAPVKVWQKSICRLLPDAFVPVTDVPMLPKK